MIVKKIDKWSQMRKMHYIIQYSAFQIDQYCKIYDIIYFNLWLPLKQVMQCNRLGKASQIHGASWLCCWVQRYCPLQLTIKQISIYFIDLSLLEICLYRGLLLIYQHVGLNLNFLMQKGDIVENAQFQRF